MNDNTVNKNRGVDEAYRAYTELGMRADLSYTMFGVGEGADKNFDEAMNFIENLSDKSNLITLSLGPHSPYVCPKQFLERIAKIQSETHLKVHLHISEEQIGRASCRERV